MRAGTSLFDSKKVPIYFEPVSNQYLPPEEFRMITDIAVPGIKPYYMVSNYGRIWHIYRQEFLSYNMDSKGYFFKPLATKEGAKACRIHRLVMLVFCYIDGCEKLFVNHKDGNKLNNCITNLEWATPSENTIHAINTGLVSGNKIAEAQVRQICELLQEGKLTLNEISELTGIHYQTISAIQGKRSHIDISDQYDIKSRKIGSNFTIDQVRAICEFYESNRKAQGEILDQYATRALSSIGIKDPGYRLIRTAKKIYTKETYTYVSCEYNF